MSLPIQKMERKPMVPFTPARKEQFLQLIRETGLTYRSLELVGVSSTTLYDHLKVDDAFKEAYEDAKQQWVDEVLVAAAVSRATKGVSKPLLGGRFKDEIVAHEQVYSDSLLAQLLRAKRKEFREKDEPGAEGAQGGVLIIPAAPGTATDWQQAFGELAQGNTGKDKHGE